MPSKHFLGFLISVIFLVPVLSGEKLGVLSEILVPEGFMVSKGEAFILEEATVFVYSLSDLGLKRRFGREGQGPGEVQVTPWLSNLLYVYPDKVVIDSVNKIVEFSREGEFLGEIRRSEQFTQMVPLAEFFAVRKRIQDPESKKQYSTVNWFDPPTDKCKELYRQPFSAQRGQVDMVPDSIHYFVYKDKLYIEESLEGFAIEVFDSRGGLYTSINLDFDKVTITREDRKYLEGSLLLDPFMKIGPEYWEKFRSQTKLTYPDVFPAIRDLFIADDKIYVQTFKRACLQNQFVILDLKGDVLDEVYLPIVRMPCYTERMMGTGVRLFCIDQNRYYFIVEEDEWCELHVVEME